MLPASGDASNLLKRREGEPSPSWRFAGGDRGLTASLVQVPWLLSQLRVRHPSLRGTQRWPEWASGAAQLLLWEAKVSTS